MTRKGCVLILAATIVALVLRLPRLEQRPMHGDEAVNAVKFGQLLEQGVYTYDPNEFHGPTLNYLTLIPAWLTSADKIAQINDFTVRIVPIVCGVLLVLLILLIADGLGSATTIFAALLTAVSPAMVFYSRCYIHEVLLVFFTFGVIASGYRYVRSGKIIWALSAGIFAGLMHATKETCIIAFGSMLLALIAVLFMLDRKNADADVRGSLKIPHIIVGLAAAIIISVLFYSSFFSNPRGILDSIRTYTTYFDRAGNNSLHIHPWYYYLKMLIYSRYDGGPLWSEVIIIILAVIGFTAAFKNSITSFADTGLLRFIAIYTFIMTVIYSAVPYKTPWCMLGFLHGMILLAGFGAVVLFRSIPNKPIRFIVFLLISLASIHLTWQAYLNNYKYYADSTNPYVYAHPTTEVFTIVEKIEYYAGADPNGYRMEIDVICSRHDYWPLPWYLRSFSRVHYRDKMSEEPPASLVIASEVLENDLRKKFYDESIPFEQRHLYMYLFERPYYVWLRPNVKLIGFVRKDLWDAANRQSVPNELTLEMSEK